VRVINRTQGQTLIAQGRLAATFWARLKGLLGAKPLDPGQGLVLKDEKSIHTLFMTFPIAVVYVDRHQCVVRLDRAMPPYRLGPFVRQSAYILEMPVGTIDATGTKVGDELSWS
jgi:uncharacterized protein